MSTGVHAVFFAALGIRTHAFEPLPSAFERMQCSARANKHRGIKQRFFINDYGLADQDSEACMVG
jgi:hypothetical protein